MSLAGNKYRYLIFGIVIFLLLQLLLSSLNVYQGLYFEDMQVHSNLETIGAILNLVVVVFLYINFHSDSNELDIPFVSLAFLGMGVFDLYHSFIPPGNNFVLSHVLSVFIGGFWFGIILLPRKVKARLRVSLWFRLTIFSWILILIWITIFSEYTPIMITETGIFTYTTDIINILAAGGFLLGSIKLFQRFERSNEQIILFIALIGILQGFSRITFHWSELWNFDWWIWHIIRLVASTLIFYVALKLFINLIKELEQENLKQQVILDAMPFGIMIVDRQKRIHKINNAATEMSGYKQNEVENMLCYETLCAAGCDSCPILDLNTTMRNQRKLLSKKTGGTLPVLKTVVPIKLGQKDLLLEGFIDISEREAAIRKLELSEQKFRDIFDSVTNSIIIIDLEGNIVDVNKKATIQYGYSKDEFFKLDPAKLIHPDYHSVFAKFRDDLINVGHFNGETIDVRKDGSTFYTDVSGAVVNIDNKPHLLAAVRDITKSKESEIELNRTLDELRTSNMELEQFAYVSSHDLQEPLRKIKNFADLFSHYYDEAIDEKGQSYISKISGSANRLQKLIDNLLTLSNISDKAEKKEVEPRNIINEVKLIIQKENPEISVKFVTAELPSIYISPTHIKLLFYHLFSNSVKFNDRNPVTIAVNCKPEQDNWIFEIIDNGIGFDMQYAEKVFTVFQQLHPRNKYKGTGIGLTICKKIIDKNNGKIWVRSQPNTGTSVYFSISKDK